MRCFREDLRPSSVQRSVTLVGTIGVRGGKDGGLKWDGSVIYGNSVADYFIYNTVNASMGPDTPTSFKPRGYRQTEVTASLGMSYPVDISAFATPAKRCLGLGMASGRV